MEQQNITTCFSSGTITAIYAAGGGLTGFNLNGRIVSSYSTANVTSENSGGISGGGSGYDSNFTNYEKCFATGIVSGRGNPRPIILSTMMDGILQYYGNLFSDCYFDTNTTLITSEVFTGVSMLSSSEFADSALLSTKGFDFTSDWKMAVSHDGYTRPVFNWEKLHKVKLAMSTHSTGTATLKGNTDFTIVHAGNTQKIQVACDNSTDFVRWEDANGNIISDQNPFVLSNIVSDTTMYAVTQKRTGNRTLNLTIWGKATLLSGATLNLNGKEYTSNANGSITLSGLSNGTYTYTVKADDYISDKGTISISGTDITKNIYLTYHQNTLKFIVTHHGTPVKNAIINTINSNLALETYSYTTDENGEATDVNFVEYTFSYTVTANGFKPYSNSFNISTSDVTVQIELTSIHDVDFFITDRTNPIKNATVLCNDSTYTSNANGEVNIADIEEGAYEYIIIANGYTSIRNSISVDKDIIEQVTLSIPTETGYNVALKLYSGTILMTQKTTLLFDGAPFYPDGNGEVQLLNLAPGRYTYKTISSFSGVYNGTFTLNNADTTIIVYTNLASSPYSSTNFTITDGTNPVENASLVYNGITYKSDVNGKIVTQAYNAGTYSYTISAQGFEDTTATITIAYNDVIQTIILNPDTSTSYTAKCTITDGNNVLKNASILVNGTSYTSNANGQILIPRLQNGTHEYTASASGYDNQTGNLIIRNADISETIKINKTVYNVTLQVTEGNSPLSNASIVFNNSTYQIGSNGSVTIPKIINGTYSYSISAAYYKSTSGSITVADTDLFKIITLSPETITETFVMTFIVTNSTNPIENANISFNGTTYTTDAIGKVMIDSISNGTYNYSISATGFITINSDITISGNNKTENIILETQVFTVTFYNWDGTVLKTETVEYEKSVTAPADPTHIGYTFTGWDVDFNNVTSDLTVAAQYTPVPTDIEGVKENVTISIYPNPVKDILYITIENDLFSTDNAILIFNTTGKIIRRINVVESSNSIDVSDLTGGVYFVKIGNTTKKIIKE